MYIKREYNTLKQFLDLFDSVLDKENRTKENTESLIKALDDIRTPPTNNFKLQVFSMNVYRYAKEAIFKQGKVSSFLADCVKDASTNNFTSKRLVYLLQLLKKACNELAVKIEKQYK